MAIHYYLSAFPIEALIASELEPVQFGTYMATGSKKGSDELIIFAEVEGGFGKDFDWKHAQEKCVSHPNGDPKHSVYLSVYRTLEQTPLSAFGPVYLTTRDGRSLKLDKAPEATLPKAQEFYVYQELCPLNPLIVSRLDPDAFAKNITAKENLVRVPKIMFADLKRPNLDDPTKTGNTGGFLLNKKAHYLGCIASVSDKKGKANKTFDRSHVESFSFQTVESGIYLSDGKELIKYPMPDIATIKKTNYDWGRSALMY